MKILLICPESTVRPMDSAWKTHMSAPLSLLVLGAVTLPCRDASNAVDIHLRKPATTT